MLKKTPMRKVPNTITNSVLEKPYVKLKVHAKSGSTRELGDITESRVDKVFKDYKFNIEETKNSGATHFDGDRLIHLSSVQGDYLRAEIKKRNASGFTINKEHWEMIKKKALMHGGIPTLINVNAEDEMLITMNLKDFAEMLTTHNVCNQ
jgi:hypothetical protein